MQGQCPLYLYDFKLLVASQLLWKNMNTNYDLYTTQNKNKITISSTEIPLHNKIYCVIKSMRNAIAYNIFEITYYFLLIVQ